MTFTIEDIARLSLFLPVLFNFFLKRKDKVIRFFISFNLFFFINDFIYAAIKFFDKAAGNFYNLFYKPIEFLFICYLFNLLLQLHSGKKIVNTFLIIFISAWLLSSIYLPLNAFNSYVYGIECIFVIALTLFYFYDELKKPQSLFIYTQPSFWTVIGFFLFFSGSFFVFIYKQTHRHEVEFIDQYINIHASFFILRNLLFTLAVYIKPEKVNSTEERTSLIW